MPHVVTEPCFNCKYTDCVVVCPCDCFHEGQSMLFIDPDPDLILTSNKSFAHASKIIPINLAIRTCRNVKYGAVLVPGMLAFHGMDLKKAKFSFKSFPDRKFPLLAKSACHQTESPGPTSGIETSSS